MSIDTLNLGSNGDGMVSLGNPYIPPPPVNDPPKMTMDNEDRRRNMLSVNDVEKNIDNKQIKMDSTPISDLVDSYSSVGMMEPPAPSADPRMQSLMMTAPQPPSNTAPQQEQKEPVAQNKNPFNLTDDQMEALLVGICAAIAISKPVQEKLATSVPRFMNDMGGRSGVGLAATGLVAAIAYYIIQRYIFKK